MGKVFAAHQGNKGERGLAVNLRISCFEMALSFRCILAQCC